ncbi:MAG: hypothetical protein KGJ12_08025, partial [Gammaproteobacteria bacterium]|nr:hypothetical protein [Gammaproteobacteria bacterium]
MKSNVLGLSIMAALLAGLSTQAYADPALTVKAGTLGVGVDLGGSVVPGVLNLRGELNGYTYDKYSFTSSNVNYNTKLKLQSAGMLADWYPFQGSFRLTGGLYYDNNKLDLNATPTNGSYTINGHSYTSQQVGNLAGRVS